MKKRMLAVIILLIAATLLLPFCFSQKNKPIRLTLTSGQSGGVYYPMAQSIAKVVAKSYPYITIDVISSKGSSENIKRLMDKEADLAIVQNDTAGDASIRTVVPLHREVLHFLVRENSGIHNIQDIIGHRVAIGPSNSGTELLVNRLLDHYGITGEDFTPINSGMNESADNILTGKIDAMFVVAGLKAPVCQKILASGKVKLIGFGVPDMAGSEVEGFCLDFPFLSPAVIPIYSYTMRGGDHPGEPEQPVATLSLRSLLVCRKNISEDVVKDITHAIFDNRATLVRDHIIAFQISEDFDRSNLQFPLHSGARAYYEREKPFFLVTYAEPMGFILSLLIAVAGMVAGLKQWISMRKKNRIDRYYVDLDKLLDRMNSDSLGRNELLAIEQKLSGMRHKAVHELIHEKLMANESFLIFQQLLSDCQRQVHIKLQEMATER
jgi:TRAP transporter TAXI family solute receptor